MHILAIGSPVTGNPKMPKHFITLGFTIKYRVLVGTDLDLDHHGTVGKVVLDTRPVV